MPQPLKLWSGASAGTDGILKEPYRHVHAQAMTKYYDKASADASQTSLWVGQRAGENQP